MSVLVIVDHDRGAISSATLGALTAAKNLSTQMNTTMEALTIGADADDLCATMAQYGATTTYQAHNAALTDFGPEA